MVQKDFFDSIGHSRRSDRRPATSGLPRTTDIVRPARLVRFVPISEVAGLIRSPRRRGPEPREAIECASAAAAVALAEILARDAGNVGPIAFSRAGYSRVAKRARP